MKKMKRNQILLALCFSCFFGMSAYGEPQDEEVTDDLEVTVYYYEEEVEEVNVSIAIDPVYPLSAAQFVRIYFPEEQRRVFGVDLYDFAVYEAGSNTNLALNRPVQASAFRSNRFVPSNAVDGSLTTKWSAVYQGFEEWIFVDLGAIYDVDRVRLVKSRRNFPRVFEIQVSIDGVVWNPLTTSSRRR